ncbi:MAG: phosphoribosylamine--glycine ligase, partial [Verrucomicrobiota bacterium]
MESLKILIVGKGGREHALARALARSETPTKLYAFPGSDALFDLAEPVAATDLPSLGDVLEEHGIDLCVAGEESYLVKDEGLAALCQSRGVPCWGPSRAAAQLEASKYFSKDFLLRHGIPTAACHGVVGGVEEGMGAIAHYPVVLKFD